MTFDGDPTRCRDCGAFLVPKLELTVIEYTAVATKLVSVTVGVKPGTVLALACPNSPGRHSTTHDRIELDVGGAGMVRLTGKPPR